MTLTPQPQQDCDHQCVCLYYVDIGPCTNPDIPLLVCEHDTRSRPSPCIEQGCTDTEQCDEICEHQRIYTPAMVENRVKHAVATTRNEMLLLVESDEWQREHDEETRTTERSAVMAAIPDILICQSLPNESGFCGVNDCFCKEIHRVESGDVCKWMQSLRAPIPPKEQQR